MTSRRDPAPRDPDARPEGPRDDRTLAALLAPLVAGRSVLYIGPSGALTQALAAAAAELRVLDTAASPGQGAYRPGRLGFAAGRYAVAIVPDLGALGDPAARFED
ncbi:MAG: hypothetical protein AAF447_27315, partial [Myxococcota bacterium]